MNNKLSNFEKGIILLVLLTIPLLVIYNYTNHAQHPLQPFVDLLTVFFIIAASLLLFFAFMAPLFFMEKIQQVLEKKMQKQLIGNKIPCIILWIVFFIAIYVILVIFYLVSTTILSIGLATGFESASYLIPFGGYALIFMYRTAATAKANAKKMAVEEKLTEIVRDTVLTTVFVMFISAIIIGGVPEIDFTQVSITNMLFLVPLIDIAINVLNKK